MEKFKRMMALLLVLVMVLSVVACSTPAEEPEDPVDEGVEETTEDEDSLDGDSDFASLEPVVLIGADNASVGAAAQQFGELTAEKVSEITGGQLTIDYFPNSQLGDDQELQNQMLAGDVDIVIAQTAQTVSFVPEVAIFDLPMVFAKHDADTIDYALNKSEFKDMMNEAYEAKNIKIMHYLQAATFREATSNKKIEKIDDFNNLKIRTMENKYHMAFWKALGAQPTPLPWPEVYVSLQQGLVDAQENAADTSAGANMDEVQDYLIMTHHILYANQFLANSSKIDGLDPMYQEALQQAVSEAAAEIEAKLIEINEENTQKLVDGGMEIVEFAPDFIDKVVVEADSVYQSIGNDIGQEYVDALLNALENPQ